MDWKGKVVVVTGAGQGIGKGIARCFAEAGATVLGVDYAFEKVKKTVEEFKAAGYPPAIALKADVTNTEEINQVASTVLSKFGKVDVLVNDVGWSATKDDGGDVPFNESKRELWEKNILENLMSVMVCSRAFINSMIEKKWGRIINISSIAGVNGSQNFADYCAAKGGVIAWTKSVAKEVAKYNITVNAIGPGAIDTPMSDRLPHICEQVISINAVKRLGKPEEIGHMAVFLASDEAAFITGQNIMVDGGFTNGPM